MTRPLLVASVPEGGGGGVVLVDPELATTRTIAPVDGLECLVRHPRLPVLYGLSADDTLHVWDGAGGRVAAVALPGTGSVSAAVVGGHLVVGHYSSGEVTSLTVDGDGVPRDPTTTTLHGSGPDPSRQDHAHPHHVLDQDGLAVVTDLGSDCLWWLRPTDLAVVRRQALAPGCGPRHSAVLPGGRVAVSGELDATLVVVPAAGDPVSCAGSTRRPELRTYPSDLLAHPAGLVVVANRNAGTLGLVDVAGPVPRLVDEQDCGGSWPLNLALVGDTVAVAQRDDDAVVLLDIDPAARTLGPPRAVPVPRPTWVLTA